MSVSHNLLSKDEVIVRHMRTHIKKILPNILVFLLLLITAIVASIFMPPAWSPWAHLGVWLVVLVVTIPVFFIPFIQWSTTTYTLTTKRVITRKGIITRTGHDLPLSRISDVTQESSLLDRIFGCGTLTLQTSSDDPLHLHDVPKVAMVQLEVSNLLFNDVQGAIDADPTE
ncbi:MAG: PH domain-containing protein [Actinomycetaceae bacterium]|nr:PH domain-containing protein [Actinomycetaceae bacterium]